MAMNLNPKHKGLIFTLALIVLVTGGLVVASVFPTPTSQNVGYAPDQPIPFSHKIHAGQYEIPCLYCHTAADKGYHSTIPPLNTCMNCHNAVKTDSPYIQKLKEHYDEGKPVEWVRIHELPDHAKFPHNRHVNAGISCQTCHGNVQDMEVLEQVSPLTMGWCLSCHRGDTAPREILNKKYPDAPANFRDHVATQSCSVCHY